MRPVFVGDVQGCGEELAEIVGRADAAFGSEWCLYLVGDLVNRGPANLRVLELVRARVESGRAHVVAGNHDLAFVRTLHGLRRPGIHDTLGELLERPDADEWAEWIRRLPLVVTGTLGAARFAMVHASVHPAWGRDELVRRAREAEALLGGADLAGALALLRGDARFAAEADVLGRLTTCRSVSRDGSWSPEPPDASSGRRAWHAVWAEAGHDYGVVYGHWSLQGLHVDTGLRGLDTGCVHHGRDHDGFLTAWVPEGDGEGFPERDTRFWRVRARRRYYPDAVAPPGR